MLLAAVLRADQFHVVRKLTCEFARIVQKLTHYCLFNRSLVYTEHKLMI